MFKVILSFVKNRWLYILLSLCVVIVSLLCFLTCSSCKSSENIVVEDSRTISVPC